MREIVFDTETTGLDPAMGHRMVEIGCVELVNRFPTGQSFHRYLNPERDMPPEAFAIHGLSLDGTLAANYKLLNDNLQKYDQAADRGVSYNGELEGGAIPMLWMSQAAKPSVPPLPPFFRFAIVISS